MAPKTETDDALRGTGWDRFSDDEILLEIEEDEDVPLYDLIQHTGRGGLVMHDTDEAVMVVHSKPSDEFASQYVRPGHRPVDQRRPAKGRDRFQRLGNTG
jgi:hypothetical protein